MYITFEGIVGSGKTTQVQKLVEYFESVTASGAWRSSYKKDSLLFSGLLRSSQGQELPEVIHVREPGSTPIAEDIRYLAQTKEWEHEDMHPLTNAYLYVAARAQTLETIVKPALERGDIVISDRSFLSSCVIQGEAQGLGMERVLEINLPIVRDTLPDVVFYLEVDIDTALSRTFDSSGDKFEREGRDFYEEIVRGYEKCRNLEIIKDRFMTIDANRSQEEVFIDIISRLGQK